ncbi:hypothetical protein niasHS_007386 [Heterodera schachtii]|uniref:ANK_REP_REGION domain-containing protein n=1 Tax=Heterodera schachtii TaxID=97005 RepID=A0ABD2JXB9_HETSC
MVAVQKHQSELVDYLLEAGASPNSQSCRLQRDMPLHFAAAHGMTQIVNILCAHSSISLNAQNGNGLTPLLNAFKNHAERSEESQSQINNFGTIETLLRFGADVSLADSASGKTVVHYAVEQMDLQLIELLRSNVSEHRMAQLVDQKNFCGETPMNNLSGMTDRVEKSQSEQMCLALITCGANTGTNQ